MTHTPRPRRLNNAELVRGLKDQRGKHGANADLWFELAAARIEELEEERFRIMAKEPHNGK
ncbi:hypothetical protein QEH32_gp36 [Corynebacterium phage EmiRose]|uniref:Uncharacterized protein n=1 Tax=Corynebacterium phage EmiRose TaxID=2565372 RepID=A0A649VPC0_9CAUD|nr:hypothetical protein QEH32_gp36 [Corynebacterium phage EmiRose]QGJ94168.1 hypothetical protein SEA_EMIROSE_36 [Corynebacterium phage EmiRose]